MAVIYATLIIKGKKTITDKVKTAIWGVYEALYSGFLVQSTQKGRIRK